MTDRVLLELAVETPYSRAFAAGRKSGLEDAQAECRSRANGWRFRTVPLNGYADELDGAVDAIRALIEKEASK